MVSELTEIAKFRELIEVFCLEDADAIRLCEDFLLIAHVWDDLIDKDKEVTAEQINQMMCLALAGITMNPFYQAHVKEYAALSLITANTWRIANRLESGNADELLGSFILRNSLMQLVYFTVILAGTNKNDSSWGIDVGEQFFREMFEGFHGKYLFFLSEMRIKNESHNESDNRHRDRQEAV